MPIARNLGRLLSLVLLTPLLSAGGCIFVHVERHPSATHTRSHSMTFEDFSNQPLNVKTENGSIDVTQWDGDDVQIEAVIRSATQERAGITHPLAHRDEKGLHIGVEWAEGERYEAEGCSFLVKVPSASMLDLNSSNGSITARGLACPVTADTSNANVIISDAVGAVDVDTSDGSITLHDVSGPVEADTSNAQVSVTLADGCTHPIFVHTSNGAIHLSVPDDYVGLVSASTSNGSVLASTHASSMTSHGSKNNQVIRLGGAGDSAQHSKISTSNASIIVMAR